MGLKLTKVIPSYTNLVAQILLRMAYCNTTVHMPFGAHGMGKCAKSNSIAEWKKENKRKVKVKPCNKKKKKEKSIVASTRNIVVFEGQRKKNKCMALTIGVVTS